MEYEVLFPQNAKYIHVRVKVEIFPSLARKIVDEMAKLQKQQDINCFLLDVREVRSRTSPFDDYTFAYNEVDATGIDRQTRVAVLVNPSDTTHNFAVTVGLNSGHNISLFHDFDVAVNWLQS